MAKLRLGLQDLLIARPLTWAVLKGEHSELFETTLLPHRRLVPLLREGALDVALVAASELKGNSLAALPDLGVVLRGERPEGSAGAVNLSIRGDLSQVETVFFGQACPGTRARVKQWLAEVGLGETADAKWGEADLRTHTPFCRSTLDIGSHSRMEAGPSPVDWSTRDFGPAYVSQFGNEPLLYVWAVRGGPQQRKADVQAAEFALKSSLRYGMGALEALSREVSAELTGDIGKGDGSLDPPPDAGEVERLYREALRFVRSG